MVIMLLKSNSWFNWSQCVTNALSEITLLKKKDLNIQMITANIKWALSNAWNVRPKANKVYGKLLLERIKCRSPRLRMAFQYLLQQCKCLLQRQICLVHLRSTCLNKANGLSWRSSGKSCFSLKYSSNI